LLVLLLAGFSLLVLLTNLLRVRLSSKFVLKLFLLLLLGRLTIFLADLLSIGLGRSFGLESHALSPPVCIVPRNA